MCTPLKRSSRSRWSRGMRRQRWRRRPQPTSRVPARDSRVHRGVRLPDGQAGLGRQRDCRPRGRTRSARASSTWSGGTCRRARPASDSATSADAPTLRQRFESSCEGSWIESQSRRWRQEPHQQSPPGAARKGKSMYIGIGTVVLIVIIVLVILMLRRRLCRADAPASLSAA